MNDAAVEGHYAHNNLYDTILQAIGKDPTQITREDLAPIDEFHIRGQAVSRDLANAAGLQQGMRVLDAGCGLGGTSRLLAAEFDCAITGIDITGDYIRTAEKLSALTGLQHRTRFVQGSVLALPFSDHSFDAVLTEHVQMNFADKRTFYEEINRVLTPDGRFIYYDILGNGTPIHYPVPWAAHAALSYLITPQQLHTLLTETGFQRIQVADETEKGILFFNKFFNRIAQKGLPASGLHLLMGDTALQKLNNLRSNLIEKRVVLESGIYKKADRLTKK